MNNQPLSFPFNTPPAVGKPVEIFSGIYWLRMSSPFSLNHVNLWILEDDDDGWTLIDTDISPSACIKAWHQVMQEFEQKTL